MLVMTSGFEEFEGRGKASYLLEPYKTKALHPEVSASHQLEFIHRASKASSEPDETF
jgi:hypothetical protein